MILKFCKKLNQYVTAEAKTKKKGNFRICMRIVCMFIAVMQFRLFDFLNNYQCNRVFFFFLLVSRCFAYKFVNLCVYIYIFVLKLLLRVRIEKKNNSKFNFLFFKKKKSSERERRKKDRKFC